MKFNQEQFIEEYGRSYKHDTDLVRLYSSYSPIVKVMCKYSVPRLEQELASDPFVLEYLCHIKNIKLLVFG